MKEVNVRRFEQALRLWEEACYYSATHSQICQAAGQPVSEKVLPLEGPIARYQEFRKHLLGIHDHPFDNEFVSTPGLDQTEWIKNECRLFPHLLATWTFFSRRVFRVTSELQELLLATSLKGVKWSDLHWPFDAFAVSLDSPIVDKEGRKFDFVSFHVTPYTDGDYGSFWLFSDEFDRSTPTPIDLKAKIAKAIRRKDLHKAVALLDKVQMSNPYLSRFFFKKEEADHYILDDLAKEKGEKESTEWEKSTRLVVGLCIYMQMMSTKKGHCTAWEPAPGNKNPDPLCITRETQVCTVSSVIRLSQDELELLKEQNAGIRRHGYELKTHFREGHWRRPPGKGNDPTAWHLANWIFPTMVRWDRRPKGALPAGAVSVVA